MDGCIKDLSNFIFEIGVSCSSPLPRAAGEKVWVPDFLQKKLKSQKLDIIFGIFFDNPTGEAFMYIMWKNQRCIFILSGLFWQRNRNAPYFLRALYFVRRWPSLGAKFGIPDKFSPNCFPITPPRNGNLGNGYRDLLDSGFKVGENSPMPKKIARRNFYKK
jgi:hypothetical protein